MTIEELRRLLRQLAEEPPDLEAERPLLELYREWLRKARKGEGSSKGEPEIGP